MLVGWWFYNTFLNTDNSYHGGHSNQSVNKSMSPKLKSINWPDGQIEMYMNKPDRSLEILEYKCRTINSLYSGY